MRILSLGAGVQSTAMLLMADAGELGPKPEHAIFADTGWEPSSVYDHLDKLEEATSIPIHRVSAGNLREAALTSKHGFASMPLWTKARMGKSMTLRRQCTREFKIEPITRQIRNLLGLKKGQHARGRFEVDLLLGISIDEASRMKPSRLDWISHQYPLVERGMHRQDCISWMSKRGWDRPLKSSCIGCPYHNDLYWRDMKNDRPEEWEDAVEFDHAIRDTLKGVDCDAFLHRSLKPLDEIDLTIPEDHGQINMFIEECEGMCGV
jgi:hypothetical protein